MTHIVKEKMLKNNFLSHKHLSGIELHAYYIRHRTRKYILKMVLKRQYRSNLRIHISKLDKSKNNILQSTKYSDSRVMDTAADDDS